MREPDENPLEVEALEAAVEELTETIKAATAAAVDELARIRAATDHREVALLERWWALA